ncbi:hypothetical protein HA145_03525 [Prochlorococcus marinus XMU1411]|uniref:hypothetical protein n=1 Tax=Prochlorococcus marinus TaxID=1219 RepID=UPI001ADAB5E3|nr:hypothetical protein [Prochlorococcus marinus]MBO8243544.1 hypothetical protein [Prochlorococcus marinus XMU1411]MBW3054659.1 hypothetical protein [Prochlorococcus marinus str. MU1411]MCR8538238.1 hypothetical protein [Prochlorococcus marinus CUG1430]
MIHRKILFLIFFLNFFLSSCALINQDIKHNVVKKTKISEEKKIAKFLEEKDPKNLKAELNFSEKNTKEIKLIKMKINNNEKVENISKSIKNFYLNFAFGYSNLENYDVYNTSTNKAIWDDRYTELGYTNEIGLGYDFGKIRTEISYAQENGRFDEYLTYFDKSITKIGDDRGKLHKDFYIINTYYDFRSRKKISPFIGLGIGFVNSVQDSAPFIPEYVRQAFVLQLKGGLSYEFYNKNVIYVEGFIRNAKSHTTNDGLGTPYIYEAKDGFDSSGIQMGFRRIL